MYGEASLGETAFGEAPGGPTYIIPEVADATKTLIFVVELDMLDITVSPAQEVTKRYASHSFVTRSTDTPAHTFIPGRVTRGLTIGRRITETDAGEFGALIQSRFGEIELNNVDGELDELIDDYYVDGREIRLYIGSTEIDGEGREVAQAYADFELVYTARSGVWEAERDVLRLQVEDRGKELQDRLASTYAGTGGYDGHDDLTGRARPILIGHCLNVPAQLIDPANQIYEFNHGPVEIIETVRDAGIAVPPEGTDYADYTALAGATVTAGTWAQCKALGLIRLETPPVGIVTAHVRTIDELSNQLHGSAIKDVLLNHSALSMPDLDGDSFDNLDTAQAAAMGIHFPAGDQSTVEEAVTRIAFSVGAFIGQDRSGLCRAQRLENPAGTPVWSFGENEIISIEREPLPYRIPWYRWGAAYLRSWTVLTGTDLAPEVDQGIRNFFESEARWAFSENTGISDVHPTAATAPLRQSLFMNTFDATILAQTAAANEATRLLGLYSLGRAIYRVTVKTALFSMELGQTVELTYPRWNLTTGRTFVIVGVDDDADRIETEFRCFG